MDSRSSKKQVAFVHPFILPGYAHLLPAGQYDILIEEELLHGLSFEAYRRTSTHMMITAPAGRMEMRPITEQDLEAALCRDREAVDLQGAKE